MTADRHSVSLDRLQRLHEMAERLLVLLERESDCLAQGDVESLMAVVEDKNAVVAQIDRLTAQLPLEDRSPSRPEADRLWRRIRDTLHRGRRLNEANGARIALLQEYNRQSLALLFGQQRRLVGYDPDGRSQVESGDRLLGAG